jgi:hypothetical protein
LNPLPFALKYLAHFSPFQFRVSTVDLTVTSSYI